jgi:hypothetical protein
LITEPHLSNSALDELLRDSLACGIGAHGQRDAGGNAHPVDCHLTSEHARIPQRLIKLPTDRLRQKPQKKSVLSFPMHSDQPSAAADPHEVADDVNEEALAEIMRVVPLGAGVLAGGAVALLVLGYLLIYLLVFVPRGVIG